MIGSFCYLIHCSCFTAKTALEYIRKYTRKYGFIYSKHSISTRLSHLVGVQLYFFSPVQYVRAGIFLLVIIGHIADEGEHPCRSRSLFCVFCNEIKLMINISKPISIYQCIRVKCPRQRFFWGRGCRGGSARVFKNQQVFIYIIQHCRADNI